MIDWRLTGLILKLSWPSIMDVLSDRQNVLYFRPPVPTIVLLCHTSCATVSTFRTNGYKTMRPGGPVSS